MSQLFGTPHQLGYVVRDINRAMHHWAEVMRIGPFYYQEHMLVSAFSFRGNSTEIDVSIAVAYSGALQIELIQPHGDGNSLFHEFLAAGHEGLHHLGYLTADLSRDLHLASEAGLQLAQHGTLPRGSQFAFFEPGGVPGTAIEIFSPSQNSLGVLQMIRTEAGHWDGSGPTRQLSL